MARSKALLNVLNLVDAANEELPIEQQEVWVAIDSYPNYFVSNMGRVYSKHSNKFLKPFYTKAGYARVSLMCNGNEKQCCVHRLVALAFIKNPDNLPEINHKDEDPKNNCVDNLEWCTGKYNCNYGNRNKKISIIQAKAWERKKLNAEK